MPLNKDLREFVELLNSNGVEYLVVGSSRTHQEAELEGIATQFIGRAALLVNKESTGRAKDLGAAEELRKRPGGPAEPGRA